MSHYKTHYQGGSDIFEILNIILNVTDDNECDVNYGGCSHLCVNFIGGYNCTCRRGFHLVKDKICEGILCIIFKRTKKVILTLMKNQKPIMKENIVR